MAPKRSAAAAPGHWHISSIQVKAFKSFGPSWCSFDGLPSQLVGIVGPNGCGKSNLLEAVCFAAAGSTSVLRLTGRSLQDVTSTDAGSQRPEVRLHISQGKATHVLEACLTAEGARAYKIDSKIKSATQVKEFLKARGIVVDGSTVIQQAAITQLSDSNNGQALAQLVAGASGLSSWNQQTAAARQEVARTNKALKDIQSNISKVHASVAAEDAALKAAAEAAQLEQELEQQVQELLQGLLQRQQALELQLEQRQQAEQQLKDSEAAAEQQLQHLTCQHKALATRQAEVLQQLSLQQHHKQGTDSSSRSSRGNSSNGNTTSAGGRSSSGSGSGSLVELAAAQEAQVTNLRAAIAAHAEWEQQLARQQQQLQQQEAHCSMLQQRLAAKQQEAAARAADAAAVKTSADATATLQKQARQADMQAAAAAGAILQQQDTLAAKQQVSLHTQARLQALQQQLAAVRSSTTAQPPQDSRDSATASGVDLPVTAAEASCAVAAAAAAAAAAATAADRHAQQLSDLQRQLLRLQVQVDFAQVPLTPPTTASLLAAQGSSCKTVPLHTCFRLKDAAALGLSAATMEQLLTPLSVIAGPAVLQTLIAPSVSDANRLLAAAAAHMGAASSKGNSSNANSSRRLRIWPLDNLSVHDQERQQRAAQQQLGPQAVMLPLDLVEYGAVHRPALLRAFGGLVIAADDATAATLMERFGLSAVTLQGTVSRKGSMTGGWAGNSSGYARKYWASKQQHDTTARRHMSCQQELSAAVARQEQLQQQQTAAEEQLASAQQLEQLLHEVQAGQAAAAADAAAVQQEQEQLQELQARHAEWQRQCEHFRAALGQGPQEAAGAAEAQPGAGGNSRGSRSRKGNGAAGGPLTVAQLQQQLQEQAEMAAEAAATAEQQLEEAYAQVEELHAGLEALQLKLDSSMQPAHQQQQLQAALQHLQDLKQQQAAEAAALQELRQELQQLQEQQAQLDEQMQAKQQRRKHLHGQASQAAAAAASAAAAIKQLQQTRQQALRDFSDSETVQAFKAQRWQPASSGPAAGAGAGAEAGADAPTDAQLQQLNKRAKQTPGKLSRMDVSELLPGQKEVLAGRLRQVAEFNQQADALKAAAAALETQIGQDAVQVMAANDVVYEDIAAGFSQLCSSLLPSLEVQLVRTGSQAHEGLQFRFRRLPDSNAAATAAAADAHASWQHSLGQLSGGQRTLVSLAMLLAVARTGGACGLLLLDEVDAALDEVNQARASALLKQLAHDRVSACQIMCVTHNSGFQDSCDGFVRVTKSAAGHSVPAAAAEAAVPGRNSNSATAAAAGGKGSTKGQKGARAGSKHAAGRQTGRAAKRVHFAD